MSIYTEVNEAVYRARQKFANRGISLLVLMDPPTLYAYMESMEWPGTGGSGPGVHPTVQGYQVVRSDIKGYMVCRGA